MDRGRFRALQEVRTLLLRAFGTAWGFWFASQNFSNKTERRNVLGEEGRGTGAGSFGFSRQTAAAVHDGRRSV